MGERREKTRDINEFTGVEKEREDNGGGGGRGSPSREEQRMEDRKKGRKNVERNKI